MNISAAALTSLAMLMIAGPVQAAPPGLSITAIYEARMLVKIADLRTDQVIAPDNYKAGARLTTIGALGVIKPSVLLVQSHGRMAGGAAQPQQFTQIEKNGAKRRVTPYPGTGPADPLTQLLRVALQPGGGSPCTGTAPLYDGRQRYDLTLSPAGGGGLYGPQQSFGLVRPLACRLGFNPISGFGHGPPKANPVLRGAPVATFAFAPKANAWVLTDIAVPTMVGTGHIALTGLRLDGVRPVFVKADLTTRSVKQPRRKTIP